MAVQFTTLSVFSLSYLVFTRIVLGAGKGPAPAVSTAMLGKWFPKERHGIGFGAVLFGAGIGPAIASPLLISSIHMDGDLVFYWTDLSRFLVGLR